MATRDGPGDGDVAGRPDGEDKGARGAGNARNHRIDQLREQIDQLKASIAEAQAEQRRAVMELNELLQEKRHIAARARRRQRAARWRPAADRDTTRDEASRLPSDEVHQREAASGAPDRPESGRSAGRPDPGDPHRGPGTEHAADQRGPLPPDKSDEEREP